MNTVPRELKETVVGFVEDPQTLMRLAKTNKEFYIVIKRDESKLSKNLCYRQIGHHLMPLALATAHSRALLKKRTFYGQPQAPQDMNLQGLVNFIDEHFPQQTSEAPNLQMTLNDCIYLFEFHSTVEHYAAAVAGLALANSPRCGTPHMGPTHSEMNRIHKSLYMLELLANLFPRAQLPPPTPETSGGVAYRPAWQRLITKFAPWELQQVRCAKELLSLHIQNVMSADPTSAGQNNYTVDIRLRRAFVSNEGLAALKELEGMGDQCGTHVAVTQFRGLTRSWIHNDWWYGVHDTMWLSQVGDHTHLNPEEVLSKYPESESGPREAWFYTLLQNHTSHVMFDEKASFMLCLRSDYHATQWGYAFWDRERLNVAARGSLPSMDEMLDISEILVQTEDLLFYKKFR